MSTPGDSIIISEEESGLRLDQLLARRFENFSRTYFQHLIEKELVLVNGEKVKKRTKLEVGDEIEVEFTIAEEISIQPENIPLDILYEDAHLIAVNKPAGMVVHPAVGNWSGTFVNALLYHCQTLPENEMRPGIVHRLDKETTGVLIAAKTSLAHQKLVALFASRQMKKKYLAICSGNPGKQTIQNKIGRDPVKRKEMAIVEEGGREAITRVETLACDGKISLVALFPETGRTHQLRVHLKAVGCPILGDSLYGNPSLNKKLGIQRQLLHAETLTFIHPITGEKMELKAPIPADMLTQISTLKYDI